METKANSMLVTGANGLIGRWLVPILLDRGYQVIAAMRQSHQRAEEFQIWVQQHVRSPFHPERLQFCECSLESVATLFQNLPTEDIIAIYHLAAAYNWGLDQQYAQRVNVEASAQLIEMAAALPNMQRFIWIGGYRVANLPGTSETALYKKLGASKWMVILSTSI